MYTKTGIGCFLFLTTASYVFGDVSHLASVSPGFKHSSGGDIPVVDDLSTSIPGEPDVDYPIYSVPPISSFSCKGRHYGYYADVESRCQVFRVCATTDLTGNGFAFLCPNGTLFNQKFFVCDWYKNVDCFASESFFARNELFGTKMGLMNENDMMSMVQGMVDYTKQPQFVNQNVNNNGGFPFTNSQLPKQLGNTQGVTNQNNGLASFGNGNLDNQQSGDSSVNRGRSNNNAQKPQRGSDILSQPIFPTENNRFSAAGQSQSPSGNTASNAGSTSGNFNQNGNFNSNNAGATNNDNNGHQPTVFVSSLGEISTDPNLRLNPFTTAIVSTKTFDTLSSNVDPVSTSADQVQKLSLHGQLNQLNYNAQQKVQTAGQFQSNNGLHSHVNLQQKINHLSESASNVPSFGQRGAQGSKNANQAVATNDQHSGSNDQSSQALTAVYSGSGDLLSHTISQYGKSQGSAQNERDPSLSVLVNSLGETILTPVFSGEGNLLSQTIGQKGPSKNENEAKPQSKPDTFATAANQGPSVSTPQPILQTPFYSEQSRITIVPFASGSIKQENVPRVNVVYSGEGNLLSQTIGRSQQSANGQSSKSTDNGAVHLTESNSLNHSVQLESSQTAPSQVDRKQTIPFTANRLSGEHASVTHQGTPIGSSSSITQTTQSIPSTQSFGQRVVDQAQQKSSTSNAGYQFSSFGQTTTTTNNNRVSFGQNLSTNSAATSRTTAPPYSPSVPPFRSTTTTTYTPTATATSYNQHTQAYNGQSHESRSYTHHGNVQSAFSNNQFQVPSKEYLPSADNTRTARTNELSFGNHGSSTLKLSSSQNFASSGGNQQDGRQQFTYPLDQTDSKILDNTNDLPNLGADADPTKQNLINRDVTHNDKYLYRNRIEQTTNETEPTVEPTSENDSDIQLSSISIGDIFDFNRILQEGGNSEDTTSEEVTTEFTDFKRSPIIVAPISNSIADDDDDDGASDDIEDSEVLRKYDESANLLFAGLQLSLYEEKELLNSEIKNELNDEIFQSQDVYETKIRNPKDVYSSGGGLQQTV